MPMCGRQGQRNEPQYLVDVVNVLKQTFSGQDVAGITTRNVQRVFGLSVI